MKNTLLLLLISAIFTQTNILTKEYNFYKNKVTNEINVLELINESSGIYKVELIKIDNLEHERTKKILLLLCELELDISSTLSYNTIEYKICGMEEDSKRITSNNYVIIDEDNPIISINAEKFNYVKGNFIFRISGEFSNIKSTSSNIYNGILREWYDNGQLYLEYTMKNGIKNGTCKKWYDNGQLQMIYNYNRGKLDGNQRKWYLNGAILGDWNYKNDKQHGILKEWYQNGQIKSIKEYNNGNLVSVIESYDENGTSN